MKIKQKPVFQPIKIKIETSDEAEAIWAALEGRVMSVKQKNICNDLANWFCQESQLIGA